MDQHLTHAIYDELVVISLGDMTDKQKPHWFGYFGLLFDFTERAILTWIYASFILRFRWVQAATCIIVFPNWKICNICPRHVNQWWQRFYYHTWYKVTSKIQFYKKFLKTSLRYSNLRSLPFEMLLEKDDCICHHNSSFHDNVIKWKHFPRYWPFARGIHRSPTKCQWPGALMFSLVYAWTNGWANNRGAVDLRRHCAHFDVIVMQWSPFIQHINATCMAY